MRMLFAVLLLLIVVPRAGSAQSAQAEGNCDWCDSSGWFNEHSHGWVEQLRENRQFHDGGPYPEKCHNAHASCDSGDLAILAERLDTADGNRPITAFELAQVLREASMSGITTEFTSVGVRLVGMCRDSKTTMSLLVPLRVEAIALLKSLSTVAAN